MYERWGRISCLRIYHKPLMIRRSDGTEYVGDNYGGPKVMSLRCECGYEWEQETATFPGRRKMRSCMRPECEFTPRPKQKRPRGRQGYAVCVYLSHDTTNMVRMVSVDRNLTFSKALDEMIREHTVASLLN